MGLREAILEGSSIFREVREEQARRLLRIALEAKFPGLELAPEIDAISTTEAFESLLKIVVLSNDRAAVKRALASAGRAAGIIRALRIVIEAKFPGLDAAPEIDAIPTTEAFEALLKTVVLSNDRAAVKRALASAARQE